MTHDVNIERQIQGLLLINNNKLGLISDYLSPNQF